MAFNGSGTFSRPVSDYVFDTVISETDMNTEMAGIATGLSTCIAKDGQTTLTANIPFAGFKITGYGTSSTPNARSDVPSAGQVQDGSFIWCGTAGGTKNALTLTPTPAIAAYATGQKFRFKAGATQSDDAVTIAISGLTTKAGQINDTALSASLYIEANKYYEALYDGTALQLTRLSLANLLASANVFTKTQTWAKGADIASPADGSLTLGTDGNYFDITGTNAITSIDTVGVGTWIKLHFDGALTLTHHATDLILPGGANITTAAGDEFELVEYATGDWRCTNYVKATGRAVVPGAPIDVQSFTSSDTWTKPSSGSVALVEVWGAGGGGARRSSGNASGGGSGNYSYFHFNLADLGATETVTIGAGGAVQSTDNTDGNAGGDTSFGSHFTMYGGRGGSQAAAGNQVLGGGSGGLRDIWTTDSAPFSNTGAGIFAANSGISGNLGAFAVVVMSGTGVTSGNVAQTSRVTATYTAGGAGFSTTGPSTGIAVLTTGPTGVKGGDGGAGNAAGAGGNGSSPGGGGGAGTTQGGSGGNGKIRVTVW